MWAIASAPSDGSPPAHIHGNYAAGACGTHVVAWEVINVTAVISSETLPLSSVSHSGGRYPCRDIDART